MTDKADNGTKKANLADLSKIPATEFEQHFHEWMERDDVARGLQAKLRCDLIKNFNKTNLGKQIQAHTMSSTGGSTYRLTLSPLVLALNTLVAEFLYAQNCHFTLSVFCTEIPFRNTLPDFESMRNYRFSGREINEIWEAVTGAATEKRCLDTTILDEYETSSNSSLLLLILKSLVEMKPQEMLRKTVEVQIDGDAAYQEKRSTSVQATQQSPTKSNAKGSDNLRHINKYLLILSQKVTEMTHEFELLVKQKNLRTPGQRKSSRSREFQTLNRSLDRINENVKQLTKSKRKGKRLTNIVESIDGLTKQFGKCAESFGEVTKELTKKERTCDGSLESSPVKVHFKEKQTETEAQEKTYSDWIYEMRTTDNGRRFLERVENSLSKAVAKHKEQWQNENDSKLRQMKSLIKLHYKQKLLMHLSRQGSEETKENDVSKLNETIEIRLKNFEIKQMELLEKLRESSFELQEAQKQLHDQIDGSEESIQKKDQTVAKKDGDTQLQKQNALMEQEEDLEDEKITQELQNSGVGNSLVAEKVNTEKSSPLLGEVNSHNHVEDLPKIVEITPRDYNVERIITEAKLRLKQLETESNCLEKHFQIYLERRKKENAYRQEATHQLIAQSHCKTSEIYRKIGRNKSLLQERSGKNLHSTSFNLQEEDLDLDEEFLRLKEKLTNTQSKVEMNANNSSPSMEIKNAILDAKHKFFENEQLFRERKEKELMKQCAKAESQMPRNCSSLGPYNFDFEPTLDINKSKQKTKEQIIVFNINANMDNKEKILDMTTNSKNEAVITDKSNDSADGRSKKSPRRELFPKGTLPNVDFDLKEMDEPLSVTSQNLRQTLKDLKLYTQNLENKEDKSTESTEDLIKQSMAKMKQLFEETPSENKESTTSISKVNVSDNETETDSSPLREGYLDQTTMDKQDINLTTSMTTTSNTTTMTSTSATSTSVVDAISRRQLNMLQSITNMPRTSLAAMQTNDIQNQVEKRQSVSLIKRPSNDLIPSPLNLTSDASSEESSKSEQKENLNSGDDISEISSEEEIPIPNAKTIPELMITPKGDSLEIGEILSEPQASFTPMHKLNSSESSENTDSEFDISMGNGGRKKLAAKTSGESESDFWA